MVADVAGIHRLCERVTPSRPPVPHSRPIQSELMPNPRMHHPLLRRRRQTSCPGTYPRSSDEPSELGIVTRRISTLSGAARCFIDCLLRVIPRHARSARNEDLALSRPLTLLI